MQNTDLQKQPYNLQIGPVNLTLATGASVAYNDNINLADSNKEADLIFTPQISINADWQVTQANALTFNMGVSYEKYLTHSEFDTLVIAPNSATQFSFYVGDFKITLFDKFSYESDPSDVGQLSNQAQLLRFLNHAGVLVDWDLNDIVLSATYSHSNLWVNQSEFKYLNYQSDSISPQVAFTLTPTMQAGFNGSVSTVRYDEAFQNNYVEAEVGPFLTTKISNLLSVDAQAGFIYADFSTGGLNGDTQSNVESYYFTLGINHRVSKFITESLTAGREFLPGLTSNYTQRVYATYSPNWQATPTITVAPRLWWENLDDSEATTRETSNRYGAGINITFAATQHTSLVFDYDYILKQSNVAGLSYQQNITTLGFNYAF